VSLAIEDVPAFVKALQLRHRNRDERMEIIEKAVAGDFGLIDEDGDDIDNKSPNLIQVALEDTAEAASVVPTVRVVPPKVDKASKKQAAAMERIATGYLQITSPELFLVQFFMDLAGYGIAPTVVWPDTNDRLPYIERRDPRTCYPETGWRPGLPVRRVMFVRDVYLSQLPAHYQALLHEQLPAEEVDAAGGNVVITLVEWFDDEEYLLAGLYKSTRATYGVGKDGPGMLTPIELERIENRIGVCPVVIGARRTIDGEARGQFDQVIGGQHAHQRLWGLMLDYADQAVYSDVWVKDLIGEMSWGGGGFIELGPNGAIGRVPPAVTGMSAQQDLSHLEEIIHLGGRWPKSRPGDIDQSIASAKFVEATAGMMNTAIRTLHMIAKDSLERLLRICFLIDKKYFPGVKVTRGILRNQEFLEEYDTADIDLEHAIRVEYGLGLGRDPGPVGRAHAPVLAERVHLPGVRPGEHRRARRRGPGADPPRRRAVPGHGLRQAPPGRRAGHDPRDRPPRDRPCPPVGRGHLRPLREVRRQARAGDGRAAAHLRARWFAPVARWAPGLDGSAPTGSPAARGDPGRGARWGRSGRAARVDRAAECAARRRRVRRHPGPRLRTVLLWYCTVMGRSWTEGDRQRFRDRNILRALTVPGRRKPAPEPDEWECSDRPPR
jgi:hypothetical protein